MAMAMAWSVLQLQLQLHSLCCTVLCSALLPQCRTSKRKWKMENVALCAYLWLLFFGRPQSQIVNAGTGLDWTGDDCRLQVAASLLGPGWWLGDTRTGILFSKRVWGRGQSGIGSTSVCLRWGFDKMIINAFLIIVMVSLGLLEIESHFPLPYFT